MLYQDRRRVARDRIVDAEVLRLELRNAHLRMAPRPDARDTRPRRRREPDPSPRDAA